MKKIILLSVICLFIGNIFGQKVLTLHKVNQVTENYTSSGIDSIRLSQDETTLNIYTVEGLTSHVVIEIDSITVAEIPEPDPELPLMINITPWLGEDTSVEATIFDKITFTDDDLIVNYTSGETQNIDLLSIRKITFSRNSMETDVNARNKIRVSFDENELVFYNLPKGISDVTVYSESEAIVRNTVVHSESPSVDMTHLGKGTYILKVNNQTIKFVKP